MIDENSTDIVHLPDLYVSHAEFRRIVWREYSFEILIALFVLTVLIFYAYRLRQRVKELEAQLSSLPAQ